MQQSIHYMEVNLCSFDQNTLSFKIFFLTTRKDLVRCGNFPYSSYFFYIQFILRAGKQALGI